MRLQSGALLATDRRLHSNPAGGLTKPTCGEFRDSVSLGLRLGTERVEKGRVVDVYALVGDLSVAHCEN
jgi:hypothetical protein